MSEKLDRIEWAVDCLKSRMDAEERTRTAADAGSYWEGYEQRGTKEKDGRAVSNCVEGGEQRADADTAKVGEDTYRISRVAPGQ